MSRDLEDPRRDRDSAAAEAHAAKIVFDAIAPKLAAVLAAAVGAVLMSLTTIVVAVTAQLLGRARL